MNIKKDIYIVLIVITKVILQTMTETGCILKIANELFIYIKQDVININQVMLAE